MVEGAEQNTLLRSPLSMRNDLVAHALATASTGSAAGPPLSARQARQELADPESSRGSSSRGWS
jgi:hypothetical protein